MNKKAIFKLSVLGITLISTFLIIVAISSSYALDLKEEYLLNDRLKLNLDSSIEKIKLETPSSSSLIKNDKDLVIRLNELGNYKITFYGKSTKEFEFKVVSEFSKNELIPVQVMQSSEIVNFSEDFTRNFQNNSFSNFNETRHIRVGEKVKWKKDLYSEKELQDEISNISKFADEINYSTSELASVGKIELSYETPAPQIEEREINENKKEVEVYSDFHYENVTAFTEVNEITSSKDNILIYWEEENKYLDFQAFDTNNNGLIDYVEWVVPHLSNQTFQIIIVTNAEHLDSNRALIADIYPKIKEKDDIWSEPINDGEYVRVRFERNLKSINDISIFPRVVSGNPTIQVYEFNSTIKIAEFAELRSNEMNKVILFDLLNSQNTFDLKVSNGSVEFDYITDPTPAPPREGLFVYGEGTVPIPRYRIWNSTGWSEEYNATNSGANIEWIDVASSPNREEYMLVVVNSTDGASVQIYNETEPEEGCWSNGTQCNATLYLGVAAAANQQKADAEYESVSGDGLVVYSDNTAVPKFRTWNGSDWSAALAINDTSVSNIGALAITGTKETIRLSASPTNGDEIALAISDSNDDSEAVIWNGTGWYCQSPILSTSLGTGQFKKLEMAYEQLSGDLIIVSIVATTAINITQKPSGVCSYTSIRQAVTDSEKIDIAEQIGSDRIMIAGSIGGTTDDMNAGIWNGGAYVNASGEDTTIYASEASPNRLFSASWAGKKNGIVAYSDSAGTSVDWFFYNQTSTTWNIATTDFAPTPAFGGAESNIKAFSFPDENKSFVFLKEDASADVWAKIYNGDTNSWSNTEGGVALEGTSSSTDFPSFDFGWLKYIDSLEVNINSPSNGNISNDTLLFNISLNNAGLYCNYSINGAVNRTMQRNGNRNFNATNSTMTDGNYLVRFYCFDSYGNSNLTQSVNFTLDTIAPNIAFTNPTDSNNTYLTRRYILANITSNDTATGLRNVTINLYNSSRNLINSTNSTISPIFINFSVPADGIYYFNATVIDRVNNTNITETRQVIIDTTIPLVTLVSPLNGQNYSSLPVLFNITTNENSTALYSFNNGTTNYTFTVNSSGTGFNATNNTMADGNYLVRFYVNDSAGNRNYSVSSNFTLDTTNPQISYGSGTQNNGANVSQNFIYVNVSVIEAREKNITFNLYNSTSLINSSLYTNGQRTINWTGLSDGTYFYNVTVFDYAGRSNSTQTYGISLDNSNPTINFTSPTETNNTYLTRRYILVNVTASDLFLSNITINLYNSSRNLINSTNLTNSPLYYNFSVSADGTYYFNATARDGSNKVNSTETRQAIIDTTVPLVTLVSPLNGQNYSFVPIRFNITTNENSTALYSFNNGTTNYTFTVNSSGTGFNATNNTMADGNYLVRFYVNDSAGNRNYSVSSNFSLDRNGPSIAVNSPISGEYNSSTILFNFTIVDFLSLSNVIFYFNATNYTYTSPVSMILPDGNYTLFVYANDTLGNLNYTSLNFSVNLLPNITFFASNGSGLTGNTSVISIVNGLYNVLVDFQNLNDTLIIYGLNKSGNLSLVYSNYTNETFGSNGFAISLEGMTFSHANLSTYSKGSHLYKCSDWNMSTLTCNNPDSWDVVSVNAVDSLFNLTLNSTDPGFVFLTLANSENLDDGYALESSPATEFGARTVMNLASSSGANSNLLLSFNISSIPNGVIIDSANLTIRCSSETLEASEAIGAGAHLVFSNYSWTEGTGGAGGNACAAGEYCWNNAPSVGFYNSTPDSTLSIPDACAGLNYTFNVANALKYAYSQNYRNISLYIQQTGSNVGTVTGDSISFSTKEFATASGRPKLNITFHSIPRVIVVSPVNGTIYNYSEIVLLRVNASDVATNISSVYANITLPNGTVTRLLVPNTSNQIYSLNYTIPILLGRYNVTFIINNTDNYINGSEITWFNSIDNVNPLVNFTSPTETNNTYLTRRYILVNVTASDLFLSNITINLYNSSRNLINSTNLTSSSLYYNFSVSADGTYYFNATTFDTFDNSNITETRQVTIDTTNPLVTLVSPINGQNYSALPISFNISTNENSSAVYSLNGGITNYTFTVNASATGFNATNATIPDGNYLVRFYVNDSAGNRNYSVSSNFTIDTTNPQISYGIGTQSDGANVSQNFIYVNVSVVESNFANITFTLYNLSSLVNVSTYSSLITSINWTGLSDGTYFYNVTIFDYAGRSNFTQTYTINLDSSYPVINFTFPTEANGSEFETDFVYVNVSVVEPNLANITFSLYNSSTLLNESTYYSIVNEINFSNLSSENMTYYYNATVFDTSGNKNSTETRTIKLVDLTSPLLVLSEPINKTYYDNNTIPLTFSASDIHLSSCWYNVDGNTNITLPNCNDDFINVTEGSHTLYLFANDTLGLLSGANVTFVANQSLLPRRSGYLVYSEGNAAPSPIRYRTWDGTSFSSELSALSTGGLGEWLSVKNAPSRDEEILVVATSLDDVSVQINGTVTNGTSCWHNGTTCNQYLNLTLTSSTINRQKADVAYETLSGKAVVVYSQNNATAAYKIWNGTGWGATLGVPQTLIGSGVISYIKMVSNPFNDEIALMITNTTALNIIIWNGTGWGCEPATLPSTTLSTGLWQHADLAYEQRSGDLFIAATEAVNTEVRYITKAAGSCSYVSILTTTMLEQGEIISVGARYGSDHIMVTQEDTSGAANSEDLESIIWNGSTMINLSGNEITAFTATSPNVPIAPVWAGTSNFGLAIYSDANPSVNIDYFRYNVSNQIWEGAAAGLNAAGPTNFGIEEQNIKAYSFIERNRTMMIFKDDNDDLWAKYYDGDTNTFGDLDGGTTFDLTVSSTTFAAFDFEFNYDRAGPDIYVKSPMGYTNSSNPLLNVSTGESAISCRYSLDGAINVSMSSANARSFYATPSASDGQHNVTFSCEDKWENLRSITQSFVVDTVSPLVSFDSATPQNGSELQQSFIYVNVSIDEDNFANVTYELRNTTSLVNRTNYSTSVLNINWTGLAGGLYFFNVSVYDLAGNFNRTETRTVNLTRNRPNVNLLYPQNYTNFTGYLIPQFNFSVSGNASMENCSLFGSWKGSWHLNQTIFNPSLGTELNFSVVNVSNDGFYTWNVYCYDSVGVLGFNSTNSSFSAFLPVSEPSLFNITQTSNDGNGNVTIIWNQSTHAYLYKVYATSALNQTYTLLNITNLTNYTDRNFSGNIRRFYIVSAWNPISENFSSQKFAAHVYTLKRTTNTRNWIGFPTNASYLRNANQSLFEIRNATAFSMWNSTSQSRITCNRFSCPSSPSCTSTNCNFDMVPGLGYEVNLNSTAPATVNWSLVGRVYDPRNVTLVKNITSFGKNWVSVYANTTLMNAQNLYGNISSVDAVSKWNSTTQTSQGLIRNPLPFGPSFIGNNFVIDLESGYEISVNSSINWTLR